MRAWEMERQLMDSAMPRVLEEEEQSWDIISELEEQADSYTRLLWDSRVPGSGAPERLMIAAVQAVENRGMRVEGAEELIEKGLRALEEDDMPTLHSVTAKIMYAVNNAKNDESSSYWKYKIYNTWEEYEQDVEFQPKRQYNIHDEDFKQKIRAGWVAQIIGGAMGTALEGYTTANLRKAFGEIRDYVRKPNTLNDDITYELAFLKAFEEKGYDVTAEDIALQWVALIPFGWSAEDIALKNLRSGIFPPQSGIHQNPFYEWIGAQMRGAICGMVAPGDPREAARLAFIDGTISHGNNGIIGEVFNALLVSLAFVETDIKKILEMSMDMLPKESEYYSVIKFAYESCRVSSDWEEAWHICERRFERYNWVHAYPNAAAEVVALWFGNGDFDDTMHIIAMEGQDVDCNAAQIMTALGIIGGMESIPKRWMEPIGDKLYTYVRTMKEMTIEELVDWTVDSVRKMG